MEEKNNERKPKELEENGKIYKIEYLGEKLNKNYRTKKVIIIGLTGVGKTTISFRLVKNKFIECSPTISLDLANYKMKVNDEIIQFQLWDTCGNDEFASNTPNLFKNTFIGIIVYSIVDKKSFEDVESWFNLLKKYTSTPFVYLIANKCDLEEERKVQKYEGEEIKNLKNFNYFLETSGKSGFNITHLLDKIAITIYETIKEENEKGKQINEGTFDLKKDNLSKNGEREVKKNKKKCC